MFKHTTKMPRVKILVVMVLAFLVLLYVPVGSSNAASQ